MTIAERIAYLKGVADTLELSAGDKKDQLLVSVLEVLDDIALNLVDLENDVDTLAAQVDEIDEDLGTLEEDYYDLDDCDCDCDCDCDDEEEYYDVECPSCGEVICVDRDILEEGSINCPQCNELLEFEVECDCDCDDCED